MRRTFVLALLAVAACAPWHAPTRPSRAADRAADRADFRHAVDSMVTQPAFRNANWGILVVDPERHDTLYAHNAGKLFMPASNQKILTGATALAQLGPDFRFRTLFAANGRLVNSDPEKGCAGGGLDLLGKRSANCSA